MGGGGGIYYITVNVESSFVLLCIKYIVCTV